MGNEIAELALATVRELKHAVAAEQWASAIIQIAERQRDLELDDVCANIANALERAGSGDALIALLAMSTVGTERQRHSAAAAAARLRMNGEAEPRWAQAIGTAAPVAARIADNAPAELQTVFVEFGLSDGERHTLCAHIDTALGGMLVDAVVAVPLEEVCDELARRGEQRGGPGLRKLELGEARTRIEDAVAVLEQAPEAPFTENARNFKAFVSARMRLLPKRSESIGLLDG